MLAVASADGPAPLHWAALKNPDPAAALAALVAAGADVEARDEHAAPPLHWAAAFNPDPAALASLVAAGADINARDERGKTPFDHAKDAEASPACFASCSSRWATFTVSPTIV